MQFCGRDGLRKTVRLGRMSDKQASKIQGYIEHLVGASFSGDAPEPKTAEWLADAPDTLHKRLVKAGLAAPRTRGIVPTLDAWLTGYVAGRPDTKPRTIINYNAAKKALVDYFGADKLLTEITSGGVDDFNVWMRTAAKKSGEKRSGLNDNTARRRLGIAKQFFRAAVRQKVLRDNPFDGQATATRSNPKRQHFVSRADADAVLEALPDAKWKLVFALSRYGGLRCPSEIVALKWGDVNWARARFTVHASKTEHHADAGIRVVPIFPELAPYFQAAFDAAAPGEIFCCPQYATASAGKMYRKAVLTAITKAALKPWPKLFHNCRATRETELAESYPVQVVCSWIGNSPAIAAKHYLQTTETHFATAAGNVVETVSEKAAQNPTQQPAEPGRTDAQEKQETVLAQEKRHSEGMAICFGTPNRSRTCNLRLRRPTLYPVELWAQPMRQGAKSTTAGRKVKLLGGDAKNLLQW